MSNFDFGGGPSQGYTPPIAHQLPPQQPQQHAPMPSGQPQPVGQPGQPGQPVPPGQPSGPRPGAGITPIGIISLLAILLLVLGIGYLGNRVWPINSRIDSAWRGLDGKAGELTNQLRGEGFTCSDERSLTDQHFHRLCARYDDGQKMAIEFAGPTSGEIMRVYATSDGPWTDETRPIAERAIDLSVPDATSQTRAKQVLGAGANSQQQVTGPWGEAGYVDGVFTVARTWSGPREGVLIPGTAAGVRERAAKEGYSCNDTAPTMICTRTANGGSWKLTVVSDATNEHLLRVLLDAAVTDAREVDPAQELEVVLPPSAEKDRLRWFVDTADQKHGQAGFAKGVVVDYRVTRSGDTTSRVVIDAHTTCRGDGSGGLSC